MNINEHKIHSKKMSKKTLKTVKKVKSCHKISSKIKNNVKIRKKMKKKKENYPFSQSFNKFEFLGKNVMLGDVSGLRKKI